MERHGVSMLWPVVHLLLIINYHNPLKEKHLIREK